MRRSPRGEIEICNAVQQPVVHLDHAGRDHPLHLIEGPDRKILVLSDREVVRGEPREQITIVLDVPDFVLIQKQMRVVQAAKFESGLIGSAESRIFLQEVLSQQRLLDGLNIRVGASLHRDDPVRKPIEPQIIVEADLRVLRAGHCKIDRPFPTVLLHDLLYDDVLDPDRLDVAESQRCRHRE